MSEIKLKPCPFCGSENVRLVLFDGYKKYYINDIDEDTEKNETLFTFIKCDAEFSIKRKISKIIEAWNRRIKNG